MKKIQLVSALVVLVILILSSLSLPTTTQAAPGVDPVKSSVVANPLTVVADGRASTTITVTVRATNGKPLTGKKVTLSASPSANVIILSVSYVSSNPTESNGVADFSS